jgi:hypothetical protein
MPRRKNPSLFKILIRVIAQSLAGVIITLIPAFIQVYQFFGGTVNMLNQLPPWMFFIPFVIYIFYVIVRTMVVYRNELKPQYPTKNKEKSRSIKSKVSGDGNALALRDNKGVINQFYAPPGKKTQKRDSKLRFEEYRDVHNGIIGLTVFNDGDADLEEKTAELIGFSFSKIGDKLINSIDMLPYEKRILRWHETDSKIPYGGHSLMYIARINEEGVHFGNLTLLHNSDLRTWWAGVEIRGKIDGDPIFERRCCLSFMVGKNIIDNNRELWLVGHPTLEMSDCDWAISLRGEEALKWIEEHEQRKSKKTKK